MNNTFFENIFKESLVVSHDAGGAELICSFIKHFSRPKYLHLSGPAIHIFKERLNLSSTNKELKQLISQSHHVITGTSWASDVENIAISICRQTNKKVITIIDHWSNYSSRFLLNSKVILPNVIIVVDKYAFKLARAAFPYVEIILSRNYLITDLAKKYNMLKESAISKNTCLYICEPRIEAGILKYNNPMHWGYTEYDAIEFFLENISLLDSCFTDIIIRPHPSEDPRKYDGYLNSISLDTTISRNRSLEIDLSMASCVVGCESFALVIALYLKKRVFSSIPPLGKKSCLPHQNIGYIRDLI